MFIYFFSLTNYIILLLTVYESRSDDTVESLLQKEFPTISSLRDSYIGVLGEGIIRRLFPLFKSKEKLQASGRPIAYRDGSSESFDCTLHDGESQSGSSHFA